VLEFPDRTTGVVARGDGLRVDGLPLTTNWVHVAVPTITVIDDHRVRPDSIGFRYKTSGGGSVSGVQVYDGEDVIATEGALQGTTDANGWTAVFVSLDHKTVEWGLGISISIAFSSTGGRVEITSAGVDLVRATRLGAARLRIRTNKERHLEFPYRSSRPIDVFDDTVERILISLHGTGGDADHYLANGLAAARAAVSTNVDPNAMRNTLVIAPQFINEDEYAGVFPPNLLRWRGGRASGAQSVELDLNNNGWLDSGTIGSYEVMDTLLARVCRRRRFPNLQRIVVAGHSNGGRFLARYAAINRFESEIAAPRGVAVRFVVMGSGSYLYVDGRRWVFTSDSYKASSLTDGWRSGVAELTDYGSVCSVDADEVDHWPWGLSDLSASPYAASVGADTIRKQFGARDVHYLVGHTDDSESFLECPERVQGPDTLAKTLLFFYHLERVYRGTLKHRLKVVPNVGHNGGQLMKSPSGLATLFSASS
jgi:hypothetical protein